MKRPAFGKPKPFRNPEQHTLRNTLTAKQLTVEDFVGGNSGGNMPPTAAAKCKGGLKTFAILFKKFLCHFINIH